MTITLSLPLPPSVNNLFVNRRDGKGRYTSPRYKAWQTEAGWEINRQKPGRVWGDYELHIVLPKMRGDADNRLKPLLDLLVKHEVTDDDAKCRLITVAKTDENSTVSVTIKPTGTIG
jgi:Holliday junction resolvase RusA-like endonuclease